MVPLKLLLLDVNYKGNIESQSIPLHRQESRMGPHMFICMGFAIMFFFRLTLH